MAKYVGLLNPNGSSFQSRRYHGSVSVGDWIYVDGGEVTYITTNATASNIHYELLNVTLAIDMRSPWNNGSVQLAECARGSAPLLNQAALWPDQSQTGFYIFGGRSSSLWYEDYSYDSPSPSLWRFTVNNGGRGTWSKQDIFGTGFPAYAPTNGAQTSHGGIGYYFGGYKLSESYPYTAMAMLPGLVTFNTTSNSWLNITASAFSVNGTGAYGGSHLVPSWGEEGLLILVGVASSLSGDSSDEPPADLNMRSVSIFDPKSGVWYNQTTGGPVSAPLWRSQFCMVGVAGDQGTYEIFIYGGTRFPTSAAVSDDPTTQTQASEQALDQVYILSLPSFAWFQADYVPLANRFGHTCHVVGTGQRQMLTIGGKNFHTAYVAEHAYDRDIFTQGLGVFDLTDLSWSSSFNPSAAKYETPRVVKQYIASTGPYPSTWDDPALGQIFASFPVAQDSMTNGHAGTNTVAIAVGAATGVVILLLLAVIALMLHRQRRTTSRLSKLMQLSSSADEQEKLTPSAELPGFAAGPRELAGHERTQIWELETR